MQGKDMEGKAMGERGGIAGRANKPAHLSQPPTMTYSHEVMQSYTVAADNKHTKNQ